MSDYGEPVKRPAVGSPSPTPIDQSEHTTGGIKAGKCISTGAQGAIEADQVADEEDGK